MNTPRQYLLLQMKDEGDAALASAFIRFFEDPVLILEEDSVSIEGSFEENSRAATYETTSVFPAERINAALPFPGLYPVSFHTRRSSGLHWNKLSGIRLFLVKTSSEDRRNLPINLTTPLERKYWAISFDVNAPSRPPKLELSWQPREVVFLAQGAPPYMIAVGREKGKFVQNPGLLHEALREISEKDILVSEAGEIVAKKTDALRLRKPEARGGSKAWQQYLIWAVLISGALLLSWMAFSLLRKSSERT